MNLGKGIVGIFEHTWFYPKITIMKRFLSWLIEKQPVDDVSNEPFYYHNAYADYQTAKKLILEKDLKVKDNESALLLLDKAINGGVRPAYGDRAFMLQLFNFDYDAISDFDKAISFDPEDSNLFFGRGLSKMKLCDFDGAVTDLSTAVRLVKIECERNNKLSLEAKRLGITEPIILYSVCKKTLKHQ